MRRSEGLKMFLPTLTTASYNSDYINKGTEHFCLSFLLYNGKIPYDGSFYLLFRLKKHLMRKILSRHAVQVQTKQTSFSSCYPRLGQKKRAWVCSVDRVDSFNGFKFASSTESSILTIVALSH